MILRVQGESYCDIKLIYTMLTDSLWPIIGVNNHRKMSFYFRKHFWMVDKQTPKRRSLMDNYSCITETIVYLYTYSIDNHLISVGW